MSVFKATITIGVNTSPLAGTEGKKLTSRMIMDRLSMEEHLADTTIKVIGTDSSDMFEVHGSSEEHLITLIENMRREEFELTVSDFQCIAMRDENDKSKLLEPYEEVVINAPLDSLDSIIEELNRRSGLIIESSEGDAEVHIVCHVSTRLLLGFKEDFTNITRGFGVFNRAFLKHDEVADEFLDIDGHKGFLISGETGEAVAYALFKIQDRGILYIKPHDKVYAGMIIGENSHHDDLEVDVVKGKALTNMRASGSDNGYGLMPPKIMTLESMVGRLSDDECIEVTPIGLTMRKKILDATARKSFTRSKKTGRHLKVLEDNS